MTATNDAVRVLDDLFNALEKVLPEEKAADEGDALDRELARPARTTAARSLRQAPEVQAFRQALTDGLIRVDTVNQLLRLLQQAIALL